MAKKGTASGRAGDAAARSERGWAAAPPPALAGDWRKQQVLLLLAALLLAGAVVQCLVGLSPDILWDMDPRSQQADVPNTLMGPLAAGWVQMLCVAAAGAALLGHVLLGGKIDWTPTLLLGLGMAGAAWHLPEHADSQWHGGDQIAALALAVAALHLGQEARVRRWMAAILVALIIPLGLRTLYYVAIEHPQTVKMFHEHADEYLRARGWLPGSSQAQLYLRRLEFAQATGWFGLSNVFGSVIAAWTVLASAWVWGQWRLRRRLGVKWNAAALLLWLLVPVVLLGVASVYLARSKGAALALILAGGVLLLLPWLVRKGRGRWAPWLALAAVGLAILVVVARGFLAPDAPVRTLFFRAQYWQACPRMLAHETMTQRLLGMGSGRYQDLYCLAKDPLNPEEVVSSHNVLIDQFMMLGVPGAAVGLALLLLLWRSGAVAVRALAQRTDVDEETAGASAKQPVDFSDLQLPGPETAATVVLVLLAFGGQYYFHLPMMLPETLLLTIVGVAGVVLASTLMCAPGRSDRALVAAGIFVMALLLMVHNQIEMTFFHVGAAAIAFLMMGLAGSGWKDAGEAVSPARGDDGSSPGRRLGRMAGLLPGVALWAGAVALVPALLAPVGRQQRALAEAAEALRGGAPQRALDLLQQAETARPAAPHTYRDQVLLLAEWADYQQRAGQREQVRTTLQRALDTLDRAHAAGLEDLQLIRLRTQVLTQGKELLDPAYPQQALAVFARLLAGNPAGLQDHLNYADLLYETGRQEQARAAYRRCLELDELTWLDPAKALAAPQRQRCEDRSAGALAP